MPGARSLVQNGLGNPASPRETPDIRRSSAARNIELFRAGCLLNWRGGRTRRSCWSKPSRRLRDGDGRRRRSVRQRGSSGLRENRRLRRLRGRALYHFRRRHCIARCLRKGVGGAPQLRRRDFHFGIPATFEQARCLRRAVRRRAGGLGEDPGGAGHRGDLNARQM